MTEEERLKESAYVRGNRLAGMGPQGLLGGYILGCGVYMRLQIPVGAEMGRVLDM